MSKLNVRIQNAISNQMEVVSRINRLKEDIKTAEMAYSSTIGRLSVLSELYQEETGRNLEEDLQQDPEWKQRIKEISDRIRSSSDEDPSVNQVSNQPVPQQPSTGTVEDKPETDVVRRRAPAKVTVDDNPPGPGPDEE